MLIHKDGNNGELDAYYVAGCIGSVVLLPIAIVGSTIAGFGYSMAILMVISSCFINLLRTNIASMTYNRSISLLSKLNLLQTIVQILFYWIASYTHKTQIFFFSWVLNTIIFGTLSVYAMRREVKFANLLKFKTYIKTSLLKWTAGLKFSGAAIPEIALTFSLELPIVKIVMGANAAGLYAIAVTLNSILYQVFAIIASVVSKNHKKFDRFLYYGVLGIITGAAIFLARPVISLVFSERYADAAYFSVFLLPATFMLGIARIEQVISINHISIRWQLVLSSLLIVGIIFGIFIRSNILVMWISCVYILFAVLSINLSYKSSRKFGGI